VTRSTIVIILWNFIKIILKYVLRNLLNMLYTSKHISRTCTVFLCRVFCCCTFSRGAFHVLHFHVLHFSVPLYKKLSKQFSVVLYVTRVVQPVATCRQSPYLHKPAIVIVTSFPLWRHWRVSRLRAHSFRCHYDVILIVTSFATELATPTVTDVRTCTRT